MAGHGSDGGSRAAAGEVWDGQLILGHGVAGYLGRGGGAAWHAHDAIQVVSAPTPATTLRHAGGALRLRAAVVGSGVPHAVAPSPSPLALVLVEPFSAAGRLLAEAADRLDAAELGDRLPPPPAEVGGPVFAEWVDRALSAIVGERGRVPAGAGLTGWTRVTDLSDVVRRTVDYVERALPGRPRLVEAADLVAVSPSRLTHLFSREVGMPFRRFVVWTRLRRAAGAVQGGGTLTAAATAAGFSDSAHLSRVSRQLLGLAPTALVRGAQIVDLGT